MLKWRVGVFLFSQERPYFFLLHTRKSIAASNNGKPAELHEKTTQTHLRNKHWRQNGISLLSLSFSHPLYLDVDGDLQMPQLTYTKRASGLVHRNLHSQVHCQAVLHPHCCHLRQPRFPTAVVFVQDSSGFVISFGFPLWAFTFWLRALWQCLLRRAHMGHAGFLPSLFHWRLGVSSAIWVSSMLFLSTSAHDNLHPSKDVKMLLCFVLLCFKTVASWRMSQ